MNPCCSLFIIVLAWHFLSSALVFCYSGCNKIIIFHPPFVRLLLLQAHRETDRFITVSGVQLEQHDRHQFHNRHVVFSSHLKSKCGNILSTASALRIILNIGDTPVPSRSHTHPSHSQNSRLLTSSLSLGVPVPLYTPAQPSVLETCRSLSFSF